MPEINRYHLLSRVILQLLHVFIAAELHGSFRDLQASTNVATIHGNFSSDEVEAALLNHVIYVDETFFENDLDLSKSVRFIHKTIVADTRADLLLHPLG